MSRLLENPKVFAIAAALFMIATIFQFQRQQPNGFVGSGLVAPPAPIEVNLNIRSDDPAESLGALAEGSDLGTTIPPSPLGALAEGSHRTDDPAESLGALAEGSDRTYDSCCAFPGFSRRR